MMLSARTPIARCVKSVAAALQSSRSMSFSFPAPRSLSEITKLPLLRREEPARIKEIWTQHHAEQPLTVSSTMEDSAGRELTSRAVKYPMFVLPVFRKEGFFNLLSQWQDKSFLLTFLEEYKKDPAAAQPWMCVTLYQDLAEEKQLSLVRGDFTPHLTKADAEIIQKQLLAFYMNDELYSWVNKFNAQPQEFDFQIFMDRHCRPFWTAN